MKSCANILVRIAALLAVALSLPASAETLSVSMKNADAAIAKGDHVELGRYFDAECDVGGAMVCYNLGILNNRASVGQKIVPNP